MLFRSYRNSDHSTLVDVFLSNCPKYFGFEEKPEFIDFLDRYTDANFLVVEIDGRVIGCGGHYTKGDAHRIAWAMFERHSLGPRNLLQAALALYREMEQRMLVEGKYFDVHITTSQWMAPLFGRLGFEVVEVIPQGITADLDAYNMKKGLHDQHKKSPG